MTHGTEHHLEEAEHVQHAKHDPFDRRVAMTMAIVAAVLAAVTLLSHRAHNETLQNDIKSNDNITDASNRWAYYQAKKNRQYMYEVSARTLDLNMKMLASIKKDLPDSAVSLEVQKAISDWKKTAKEYKETDVPGIEAEARNLTAKAKEYEKKAEHSHHQGDFYDLGELGVELALVFCSIAVLTKKRGFWYSGMGVGAVGLAVALWGYSLGWRHGHGEEHAPGQEHTTGQEHQSDHKPDRGHDAGKDHKATSGH